MLSAVFVPMAFFGGSTGAIYRQFSLTMVSAMVLSVIVALTLTPALCATVLKPPKVDPGTRPFGNPRLRRWFNRDGSTAASTRLRDWYVGHMIQAAAFWAIC